MNDTPDPAAVFADGIPWRRSAVESWKVAVPGLHVTVKNYGPARGGPRTTSFTGWRVLVGASPRDPEHPTRDVALHAATAVVRRQARDRVTRAERDLSAARVALTTVDPPADSDAVTRVGVTSGLYLDTSLRRMPDGMIRAGTLHRDSAGGITESYRHIVPHMLSDAAFGPIIRGVVIEQLGDSIDDALATMRADYARED